MTSTPHFSGLPICQRSVLPLQAQCTFPDLSFFPTLSVFKRDAELLFLSPDRSAWNLLLVCLLLTEPSPRRGGGTARLSWLRRGLKFHLSWESGSRHEVTSLNVSKYALWPHLGALHLEHTQAPSLFRERDSRQRLSYSNHLGTKVDGKPSWLFILTWLLFTLNTFKKGKGALNHQKWEKLLGKRCAILINYY